MMIKKRGVQFLVLVSAFLTLLMLMQVDYSITGFAIFTDSGTNFDNGTYQNTEFNGSSVVLSGANTDGNYTSRIFDAGNLASWNNISFLGNNPSLNNLLSVDGQADVWKSIDSGSTWALLKDDYNGAIGNGATYMITNSSNDLFILHNQDVWSSTDSGVTWTLVNDDFNAGEGDNGLVFEIEADDSLVIIEGDEEVWKSSDSGTTFSKVSGDINGGNGNIKGLAADTSNSLFAVDGQADVWKSSDSGMNWTLVKDDYNGGIGNDATDMASNSSNALFILHNQDVWKSTDSGITWTLANDDFNGGSDSHSGLFIYVDSNNHVYVVDGGEEVFRSTDSGTTFTLLTTDFNGGNGDIIAMSAAAFNSNLTYQFRNCSSADCSDGTFIGPDGTANSYFSQNADINLNSRYFQYKFFFSSDDSSITPLLDSATIDYELLAIAPTIEIDVPVKGTIFGNNESLPLNFTISELNIDSCWYTIDGGITNNSLPACDNTTFSVPMSGSYVLMAYVNESISGLIGNDSVSFGVEIGAPDIAIITPTNGRYLNSSNVSFLFNATSDLGIDSCELYGNFSGSFGKDQTNSSIISGGLGSFFRSLTNGAYIWNIHCNNTQGVFGQTGNYTMTVDTQDPLVNIIEPNGTYNDTQDIPLNYTVNDTSPLTQCTYNITFSIGGQTVGVGVIGNCESTYVDVTTETSYDLNLTAEDQAGNTGSSTTNFIVGGGSGGGGGGSSGGGGGGSGGSSGFNGPATLTLTALEPIQTRRGESELVSIDAVNSGSRFLNNCKLSIIGALEEWTSSDQVKSIASGEKTSFVFALNVPRNAEPGQYSSVVSVQCNEIKGSTPLNVEVASGTFDFFVLSSVRDGLNLVTTYVLQDNSGRNQEISLKYSLLTGEGVQISEGIETVQIAANERAERTLEIELPKDAEGNYIISFEIAGNGERFEAEQPVNIAGVTGFAVSDDNFKTLSILGLVILALGALALVVRFIQRNYSKTLKSDKKSRAFIPLKLN